jgi:hypothetical protein
MQVKTDEKLRLPAGDFEALILDKLRMHLTSSKLDNRHELLDVLDSSAMATQRTAVVMLVSKIIVHEDQILIHLKNAHNLIAIEYRFSTRGQHMKLFENDGLAQATENQKQTLLKSYLQGTIWRKILFDQDDMTIGDIAKTENKNISYITRLINFSFMAPDLVDKILKGDIPVHVTRENLIYNWPISWAEQRRKFA